MAADCPAWSQALAQPPAEFAPTPLAVRAGQLPSGLRGTLYRNGPARLQRGGRRVGHWFDGDGAILTVRLGGDRAWACYRYVRTAGYQREERRDRFELPNYGMRAPGPVWNNWIRPVKNAANTAVLALPDRLLALWEGGHPHALDPDTLETWGIDGRLGLAPADRYSAHPKIDPQTGEIFNFGVVLGRNTALHCYRHDRQGQLLQRKAIPLSGAPLIHDCLLAGPYLIFMIPPVRAQLLPVLLGRQSYGEALRWCPELGTEVLVLDRQTLAPIARNRTDPWFQWHHANAHMDGDGSVVAEMVAYPDFATHQYLREVATGRTQTEARGQLIRVRLDPQTGRVLSRETLLERGCEFPVVPQAAVGQAWRHTYLAVHREGADARAELLGAIARFDRHAQTLSVADAGPNRYPSEPICAPDADNPNQHWVLAVVYDGNRHASEVWLYASERLDAGPVCRLALPSVVPPSFHGTWQPAA